MRNAFLAGAAVALAFAVPPGHAAVLGPDAATEGLTYQLDMHTTANPLVANFVLTI